MRNIFFMSLMVLSTISFAAVTDAEKTAKEYLGAEVTLSSETSQSYFFITGLEYKEEDVDQEYPCFRGVVVSKSTNEVAEPSSDDQLEIFFAYSDTYFDGLVVVNCAD